MLHFSERKAAEAASVLLRLDGGKMEHLRLLTLLYFADRENLGHAGEPITMSRSVAMDHGPASSEIYDLVRGARTEREGWSDFISAKGKSVSLNVDPGRSRLSKSEIEKLTEISRRYEDTNTFALVNLAREMPEWRKNKPDQGSSRLIPLGDIIDAVGMSAHKEEILADLRQRQSVNEFFDLAARGATH